MSEKKTLIFLTLTIPSLVPGHSERPVCGQNENKICCLPKVCPPGTESIPCYQPNTRARCQPCPKNEFKADQSEWGMGDKCFIKKPCNRKNMITIDEGNSTTDRECGCEEGFWLDERLQICRDGYVTRKPGSPPSTENPSFRKRTTPPTTLKPVSLSTTLSPNGRNSAKSIHRQIDWGVCLVYILVICVLKYHH